MVIIGAGPTGLAAASEFARAGFDDWLLLEKLPAVGGLSRSITDDAGFTWDIGGHVVFSHYDRFTNMLDDVLAPDEWLYHERESWIRILDAWVPYPFQNNIHRLPAEYRDKCLADLKRAAENRTNREFANFEDFILRTFGEGISDLFMRPYNRKVWACEPALMEASWIADRVSVPDVERVERNVAANADDVSWGPNQRFRFPANGGTGEIWRRLAARLDGRKVRTGCEVVEIDTASKTLTLADGERLGYGTLISTMPLDRLACLAHKREWADKAAALKHSSVVVTGLGIEGAPPPEMRTKCWMYFPEEHAPFYRVTHFSHYSPGNVDDISRHWSLMAETALPAGEGAGEDVEERVIAALAKTGIIEDKSQVFHTWTRFEEYSYPIPAFSYREASARLLGELADSAILSRGRFGAWHYEIGNMDHSFMQGTEAARSLLFGEVERTLSEAGVR